MQRYREYLVVYVLPIWRSAVAWERRVHAGRIRLAALRRRRGLQTWRKWIRSRHTSRSCHVLGGDMHARHSVSAMSRRLGWWAQCVSFRKIRSDRHCTVAGRRRLTLCRWALVLWDASVRISLCNECSELLGEAELAGEAAAALEVRRGAMEDEHHQGELAHADLADEVQKKAGDVGAMWARVLEAREETASSLLQLEEDRVATEGLARQVARLKMETDNCVRESEPALERLEVQLAEAMEVQGSLRFAVLTSEAEVDRIGKGREAAERREAELCKRLEDSRRAYVHAIDDLDRKRDSLTKEGWDAQQTAVRLAACGWAVLGERDIGKDVGVA